MLCDTYSKAQLLKPLFPFTEDMQILDFILSASKMTTVIWELPLKPPVLSDACMKTEVHCIVFTQPSFVKDTE